LVFEEIAGEDHIPVSAVGAKLAWTKSRFAAKTSVTSTVRSAKVYGHGFAGASAEIGGAQGTASGIVSCL